jgi:hypothetical protein
MSYSFCKLNYKFTRWAVCSELSAHRHDFALVLKRRLSGFMPMQELSNLDKPPVGGETETMGLPPKV